MQEGKAIYTDYPIDARIKKDDTIFINYTYLVTYRNTVHLPITRVDNFKDKMEAIKYLQKIEPETPLISHHGRPLRIPHQEDAWLYWRKWLKKNNLFSALSTKQHCPFWLNPKGYRDGDNYLKEFVKVDAPSGQIPLFK